MPHKKMNVKEAAEYLHMARADLEALVRCREIFFEMKGNQIVFQKKQLETWASRRLLGFSQADLTDFHKATSARAHNLSATHAIIPELIRADYIDAAATVKTRASIIRHLVKQSSKTGLLVYPEDLLRELEEREKMCSTALSGGVALLHPRHHEPYMFEDSFIVLARTAQAIPFGAPDGTTTDLFFLVCCQEERIHLHVLARLSMLCYHTGLLMNLREAADAREMNTWLVQAEEEIIRGL